MTTKKTSQSPLSFQDDLLHEVLKSALNDEIILNEQESNREPRELLNGNQTKTNKNLQSRKVNIDNRNEMSKLAALDLFIRPDGLPVTFVVTSSRAQLRSKVNISKRKVLM